MEKLPDQDVEDRIFSTRNFLRTLSYREFITSLSLALLLLAIYELLNYYGDEDWVQANESTIRFILLCVVTPINHVFYKIEHKRPNNFTGRNMHDYIFLLLFMLLQTIRSILRGSGLSIHFEDVGSVIVVVLVFITAVVVFELVITIIKRGLNLLRWQIF